MTDGLTHQYPDLANLFSALDGVRQHEVALAIAEVAVRTSGTFLPNHDPAALAERVEVLDEVAWDLQDEAPDRYVGAFKQARAANAVLWCVRGEPAEAIYEAIHALDDDDLVMRLLAEASFAQDTSPD